MRPSLKRFPGWLVLLLLFSICSSSRAAERNALVVQLEGRPAYPGGILRITIKASRPIIQVEAQLIEKRVLFRPERDGRVWTAIAGIDLETKPGEYTLRGKALGSDEQSRTFEQRLRILPKKFPEQRITVDEKYVSLSPADQKRADEEAKRTEALWEMVSPEQLWSGRFLRPIETQLTSGFGRRRIVNNQPRSPHAGVDFKASAGTPIKAANSGKVVLAENLFFSGNTVIIDHGLGIYTYYGHCSSMAVTAGEVVRKGQIIGTVGATGRVTGPHLHWSCRLAQARVNPLGLTTSLLDH